MADEEQDQTTTPSGWTLQPDFYGGEEPKVVSAGTFARLAVERTSELGPRHVRMMMKLAAALPEEMRTSQVAKYGDLRALLTELLDYENDGWLKGEDGYDDGIVVGGQQFTNLERNAARDAFYAFQARASAAYETAMSEAAGGNPDAIAAIEDAATVAVEDYRDGQINRISDLGQLSYDGSGNVVATGAGVTEFGAQADALASGDSPSSRYAPMTQGDLRMLLQTERWTMADLDAAIGAGVTDANYLSIDPTTGEPEIRSRNRVDPRFMYDDQVERDIPLHGSPQGRDLTRPDPEHMRERFQEYGRDWYSRTEIKQLPFQMTREEFSALYDKMADAGMFRGNTPTTKDDPYDPAFTAAWDELALSSFQQEKSILQILAGRQKDAELAKQQGMVIQLTDPAFLTRAANTTARATIGRKLSDAESEQLVEFLHDLERKNAAALRTEVPEGSTDNEEIIVADIASQTDDYIEETFADEFQAANMAGQYDQFTRLIQGPGV